MKKTLIVLAGIALLAVGFSSCSKLTCQCQATGAMSQAQLETILNRHINDCVEIAKSGPIHDGGATITCNY